MELASRFTLKSCLYSVFFIAIILFATDSYAQSKGKKKKEVVDFEDQLIQGEVQKPELFYLLQKKQFYFSKLIKLRENFVPEMRKTAETIPRGTED